MFKLFGFQWQHSSKCLNLLHWPQITFIFLPSLALSYLVGSSSKFQYSLASPILSSQMIITFYVWAKCPSSSPMWLFRDMVVNMFERKLSTNCYMFDVEGNLLVSIYIHNILPPFHLHLTLSLIMPCTLVHPFIFFGNVYKTWPLVFQIYKLDGLS